VNRGCVQFQCSEIVYRLANGFAYIRGWSNQIVTRMALPSTVHNRPQVGNDFRRAREIRGTVVPVLAPASSFVPALSALPA
jgi:hypothetical protein